VVGELITVVEMKFSKEIKALRKRSEMTQAAFAKSFAIPLATLRNWEQGKNEPSEFTKAQLRRSEFIAALENRDADALKAYGEIQKSMERNALG